MTIETVDLASYKMVDLSIAMLVHQRVSQAKIMGLVINNVSYNGLYALIFRQHKRHKGLFWK